MYRYIYPRNFSLKEIVIHLVSELITSDKSTDIYFTADDLYRNIDFGNIINAYNLTYYISFINFYIFMLISLLYVPFF